MKKNEFLNELRQRIQPTKENETEQIITFFSESIDDRIENGISEEDAVADLGTIESIVETIARESDGSRVTISPNKRENEYAPSEVSTIIIEDENTPVEISPSHTGEIKLAFYEHKKHTYTVTNENGILFAKGKYKPFSIFPHFDKVIIEIPELTGSVSVKTTNAAIRCQKIKADKLSLTTTNGLISLENAAVNNDITLKTGNARIEASSLTAANLTAKTTNGRVRISSAGVNDAIRVTTTNAAISMADCNAASIISKASCGAVDAVNTSAEELIDLLTSNAAINVEGIKCGSEIKLNTSNGTIKGNIDDERAKYTVCSNTSNGSNTLGCSAGGSKSLNANTSNGSIRLQFVR